MKKRRLLLTISVLITVFVIPLFIADSSAAQSYYFAVPKEVINIYWNEDGTSALDYVMDLQNSPSGHVIDFVDLGMPNDNYDPGSIQGDVDGHSVANFSTSDYQGSGSGFAVGLGGYSIPPGGSGTLHVSVGRIERVLYRDSQDSAYASALFMPSYFGSQYIDGSTQLTVTFHLPPGVQPEEPRWHAAPSGFNDPPQTGFDDQGRIIYTWTNLQGSVAEKYTFGASFPLKYVPETAIVRSNPFAWIGKINFGALLPLLCVVGFGFFVYLGINSDKKRRLQYLPPRISVEGHGIKRGLTAVEAAILLEQPLDKIMTMILFSTIKKNAAEVVTRDPLELKVNRPLPEGLNAYETEFLDAFEKKNPERRLTLQNMFINLVKSVGEKMKGFSRRETLDYYRSIIQRAWNQVQEADTPEVKSQKFDEVMEWTMLDRDFGDRTQEVFRNQPIFIPIWWGYFDPTFRRGPATTVSTAPAGGIPGGMPSVSMPHLPGSDFAASIANSIQGFSSKVVGNLTEFTGNVTTKTNPVPKPTTYSSRSGGSSRTGGGCACACACACAGCACACAGGGR